MLTLCRVYCVQGVGLEHNKKQIVSDELQGVTRNPFAFYFPIQRVFSGPFQTLPIELPVPIKSIISKCRHVCNEP